MGSRKRGFDALDAEEVSQAPSLLDEIRNMWEFACLMQYIFLFGKAAKVSDDIDVETLETELASPTHSQRLSDIGFALLKNVSSNTKLTPNDFDEYTRRQYVMKIPDRNPFGTDEEPLKFSEFDASTKLRVLHQLSVWTLWNPDKVRYKMEEQDELDWRIEPFGWDKDDRTYFVLDDNRLYRRTDPPPPSAPAKKAKAKPKPKKTRGTRASKRQKLSHGEAEQSQDEGETEEAEAIALPPEDNGLGGAEWKLIAISLEQYNEFLESIRRSKDPNEKTLFKRLVDGVLPLIEKEAENQERRAAKKQKELENMQKLAFAKRSSRLAGKHEKQREREEAEAAERKKKEELAAARKEYERQRAMEKDRESRMMTREQRLKDREMRRVLHEDELAKLEEAKEIEDSEMARTSERNRKAEKERRQKELDRIKEESEEWDFDCAKCGVHGRNLDDGTHSVACEKCGVWQHSACHGLAIEEAERDDFHFICASCSKPVNSLKLNMSSSESPKQEKPKATPKPKSKPRPKVSESPAKQGPLKGTIPRPPNHTPAVMVPSLYKPQQQQSHQQQQQQQHTRGYPPMGTFQPPHSGSTPQGQYSYHQRANQHPSGQFSSQQQQSPHYSSNSTQSYGSNYSSQQGLYHPQAHQQDNVARNQPSQGPTLPSIRDLNSPNGQYNVNNDGQSGNRLMNGNIYHSRPQQYESYQPYSTPQHSSWNQHTSGPSPFNSTTPHNSFLNDFGRQRPSSSHSSQSHTSPAPSFSATQGNTDVRFSPSQNGPNSHSYAPTTSRPVASAYSPTKQDSSPPPPMPPPRSQYQPPGSPSSFRPYQSPSNAASTFRSPGYNATPPRPSNSPSNTGFNSSMDLPNLPPPGQVNNAPAHVPASGPGSGIQLPPIPSLSPSVNAGQQNLEPPIKKPAPESFSSTSPHITQYSPDLSFPKPANQNLPSISPLLNASPTRKTGIVDTNDVEMANTHSRLPSASTHIPVQNPMNGSHGSNGANV